MQRCDSVPVKPGPRPAVGPVRMDVFTRNVQFMVGQVEIFLLPDRLELLYWQSAKADIANSSVILS